MVTDSGVISANRSGGLGNHWGLSLYITYCSCSSNTVLKVRFTEKNKIINSWGP